MCRKVDCSTCKKPTFAGCGQHIESALADVKVEDRCMGWRTGICIKPAQTSNDPTTNDAKKV